MISRAFEHRVFSFATITSMSPEETHIENGYPHCDSLPVALAQLARDIHLEELPESVEPLRQDLADGGSHGFWVFVLDGEEGHDALSEDEDGSRPGRGSICLRLLAS